MNATSVNTADRMNPVLRRLLNLLGIDRAVFFGVLWKAWPIASGLVTMFIIVRFLTAELQGYYYTFNSLLALSQFVELSLSWVIMQFASHEWADLAIDEKGNLTGDSRALSRLRSLTESSFKWYLGASLVLLVGLLLAGSFFFLHSMRYGVHWAAPWVVLCFTASANISLYPVLSVLEGCGQISEIFFFLSIQAVLSTVTSWLIIIMGGGLWAIVGSNAVLFFWTVLYLFFRYYNFFRSLLHAKLEATIDWWKEIWPMQWRVAVSGISSYFITSLFVPVMFHYRGAAAAGQMGMTWSMINALSVVASMWIVARTPQFGLLAAKKEYRQLDGLLFRSLAITVIATTGGAVLIFGFVSLLYAYHIFLAARILQPVPTLLFLAAAIVMQVSSAQSFYLRAHKQDPFAPLMVAAAALLTAASVFATKRWGDIGLGSAYFGVVALFIFPLGTVIWLRCRKYWHRETIDESVFESEEIKG